MSSLLAVCLIHRQMIHSQRTTTSATHKTLALKTAPIAPIASQSHFSTDIGKTQCEVIKTRQQAQMEMCLVSACE